MVPNHVHTPAAQYTRELCLTDSSEDKVAGSLLAWQPRDVILNLASDGEAPLGPASYMRGKPQTYPNLPHAEMRCCSRSAQRSEIVMTSRDHMASRKKLIALLKKSAVNFCAICDLYLAA